MIERPSKLCYTAEPQQNASPWLSEERRRSRSRHRLPSPPFPVEVANGGNVGRVLIKKKKRRKNRRDGPPLWNCFSECFILFPLLVFEFLTLSLNLLCIGSANALVLDAPSVGRPHAGDIPLEEREEGRLFEERRFRHRFPSAPAPARQQTVATWTEFSSQKLFEMVPLFPNRLW